MTWNCQNCAYLCAMSEKKVKLVIRSMDRATRDELKREASAWADRHGFSRGWALGMYVKHLLIVSMERKAWQR